MADSWKGNVVCDLTFIMRSRLLCGLFSQRAVPPLWQGFARVYCITLAMVNLIYFCVVCGNQNSLSLLHWTSMLSQYLIALIVSLWTGDEYIYTYFTRNKSIDVALDSPMVYNRFLKQLKTTYVIAVVLQVGMYLLGAVTFLDVGLKFFISVYIPSIMLDFFVAHVCISKLLVLGLFKSRILVLRRKLERYGFRTIGHAPPQPYCQLYDEIWQNLYAMDNPLKYSLFVDLILNSLNLVSILVYYIFVLQWTDYAEIKFIAPLVMNFLAVFLRLFISFGDAILLETAAAHCEAMAVFTVTQLVKNPSVSERQHMYQLLHALEQRGARYHVLRALPIDAQLVMRLLGFCTAQALVLVSILKDIN